MRFRTTIRRTTGLGGEFFTWVSLSETDTADVSRFSESRPLDFPARFEQIHSLDDVGVKSILMLRIASIGCPSGAVAWQTDCHEGADVARAVRVLDGHNRPRAAVMFMST